VNIVLKPVSEKVATYVHHSSGVRFERRKIGKLLLFKYIGARHVVPLLF
jgi:hypothetical protein